MALVNQSGSYLSYLSSSYLLGREEQLDGSINQTPAADSPFVVQDVVTISSDAQSFLEAQAKAQDLTPAADLIADLKSHGNLISASFVGKNLQGIDLTGAFLYKADFSSATLDYSVLKDAWLSGADFTGATLIGADLRGANLSGATGLTSDALRHARVDTSTSLPIGVVLKSTEDITEVRHLDVVA